MVLEVPPIVKKQLARKSGEHFFKGIKDQILLLVPVSQLVLHLIHEPHLTTGFSPERAALLFVL